MNSETLPILRIDASYVFVFLYNSDRFLYFGSQGTDEECIHATRLLDAHVTKHAIDVSVIESILEVIAIFSESFLTYFHVLQYRALVVIFFS